MEPARTTGLLGDWYSNVIGTAAGDLIIFVNERTLLTVAVPASETPMLLPLFRERVFNLLMLLEFPEQVAIRETSELNEITLTKTTSRRVLGSVNELARQYQGVAEDRIGEGPISLSDVELGFSKMLHGPLDFKYPVEVAKALLLEPVAGEIT
jgi:hypothetical protein